MKTHIEYEVGDTIRFNDYCYTNELGGTELLSCHESLQGKVYEGKVVKAFFDYETGQHFHVVPSAELIAILKKKKGGLKEHKLYVSEFDLVK